MRTHLTWPVRSFAQLVHVGTLRQCDKGARGPSHEGAGLSISTCPAAWVRIAKLGGLPWWRLERPGHAFLDAHALTRAQRRAIAVWGAAQGWVAWRRVWRLRWFDDELDGTVQSLHESEAAARREAFDEADADVTRVRTLVAHSALVERMGQTVALGQAEALLHAVYAEDVLALDGVFWADVLDVDALSAPRAVIFRSRLPEWRITPMPARPDR
jgi:hypothetical protein